ncbi:Rieske [2Fe-2S] iron-sulfur domain-containing protein [Suillus subluteus]|nr:Rieske [2Fe-2S] iron-sulfur domain-containing protein [Suillus subluteus]
MASYAVRKSINLAPTVRALPNGIPSAPRLNFAARAPSDDHGHGATGPRADVPTRLTGTVASPSFGLVSKTFVAPPPTTHLYQRLIHTSVAVKDAPQVPDFTPYRPKDETTNRAMSYFMVGSLGVLSASVAQSTITGFLETMAASADVLALAKTEVELASIPEGKNVIIKWRGKPVFIRHRTPEEIEEARTVDLKALRDPQRDEDRVKKPEWLVMLGVCTHLGCVPIGESGDYGGWFCPCHGSHYDISGRARKGPAPVGIFPLSTEVILTLHCKLNLEIPPYDFNEVDGKLIVG